MRNSAMSNSFERPNDCSYRIRLDNVKRYPWSTLFLAALVWAFYLWGISVIGWSKAQVSLTSPLSPSNPKFWYYGVDWWPSCRDMRWQGWRLISVQLVHTGFLHIGGNCLGLLFYGLLAESYFIGGSLGVLLIFQSSIILGALGHAHILPFEGLVGCSAGVYGLTGCSIAIMVMDYENVDKFASFVGIAVIVWQHLIEVFTYFFYRSQSTSYAAHIAGYLGGLSLGFVCYAHKSLTWRRCFAGIGFALFATELTYLTYSYVHYWPPRIIESGLRPESEAMSCCSQYLDLLESTMSRDEIMADYYCHGNRLIPIATP